MPNAFASLAVAFGSGECGAVLHHATTAAYGGASTTGARREHGTSHAEHNGRYPERSGTYAEALKANKEVEKLGAVVRTRFWRDGVAGAGPERTVSRSGLGTTEIVTLIGRQFRTHLN